MRESLRRCLLAPTAISITVIFLFNSIFFQLFSKVQVFGYLFALFAQLSRVVEYTDCFSAEGYDSPNECPDYDTKSDGEVPVMREL